MSFSRLRIADKRCSYTFHFHLEIIIKILLLRNIVFLTMHSDPEQWKGQQYSLTNLSSSEIEEQCSHIESYHKFLQQCSKSIFQGLILL